MEMKRYIPNQIKSLIVHLKRKIFATAIVTGIGITTYGIFELELATTIAGAALITAGAIGLVMSLQTEKIAADIRERFDRQDELAELRHKEVTKYHKESLKKHDETVSLLREMLKVLQRIDEKLDRIGQRE